MGFMRPREADTEGGLTGAQGLQVGSSTLRQSLTPAMLSLLQRRQAYTANLQAFCPQLRTVEFARPALEALHLRQLYAQKRGEELLSLRQAELARELARCPEPRMHRGAAQRDAATNRAHPQLSGYVQQFSQQLQCQRASHGHPYDTQAEIDLLRRATVGLVQRYRALGAQGRPDHLHEALQQISHPSDQNAVTQASLGILRSYRPGDALQLQRLVDEGRALERRAAQDRLADQAQFAQHMAERKAELWPQVQRQAFQEAGEADLMRQLQIMRGVASPCPTRCAASSNSACTSPRSTWRASASTPEVPRTPLPRALAHWRPRTALTSFFSRDNTIPTAGVVWNCWVTKSPM